MLPNLNGDVNSLAYLFCMSLPIVFILPRRGYVHPLPRITAWLAYIVQRAYTRPRAVHHIPRRIPPTIPATTRHRSTPYHRPPTPPRVPTACPCTDTPRALCSNALNAVHPPHLPRAFCCLFDPHPIVLASVYILSTSNSKLTIPKEGYLQNPPDQNYQPTEGSIQPPIITPATRL